MNSEDDAEARIRALEQPLADSAKASEAAAYQPASKWAPPSGPPVPPPVLQYSGSFQSPQRRQSRVLWFVIAAFVISVIALPIAIFLFSAHQVSRSGMTTLLPAPSMSSANTAPSGAATRPSTAAPLTPIPPVTNALAGGNLSVAGINEVRTIACNNNTIDISGVSNQVVITGDCTSVTVSGVKNTVKVEATQSIQASGFNNDITYLNGAPQVQTSGGGNVVHKG